MKKVDNDCVRKWTLEELKNGVHQYSNDSIWISYFSYQQMQEFINQKNKEIKQLKDE